MGIGFIPKFQIIKGGEDITNRFQDRAVDIKVELSSGNGSQDTCTISIDDRDWLVSRPRVDDYLDIYLGYEGVGLAYQGTFEIDEVTFLFPPKSIKIHGNAQGNNSLLKCPEIKGYADMTVGEIMSKIGEGAGLGGVTVHPSIANEKIKFKNNTGSPAHLITQLEQRYNAVAKLSNGQLSLVPKDSGSSATGQDLPLLRLQASHFADCQVRHTNRSDYTKVKASYADPKTNDKQTVESDTAVRGLPGNAKELPYIIKEIFPTKEEAEAAAKSQMKALDRNLGEGNFTLAEGDPWVRDQQRILVAGCRDGIDGSYVADIVTHHFTKSGALRTAICAKPPEDCDTFARLFEQEPTKFLSPAPGQVIGQVLPQSGLELPKPFNNVPSLIGQPLPFTTN